MGPNLLIVMKDGSGTGLIFEPQITVEITSKADYTTDTPEKWSQDPSVAI